MRISDWSSDVCSSDLPPCSILADTNVRTRSPKEIIVMHFYLEGYAEVLHLVTTSRGLRRLWRSMKALVWNRPQPSAPLPTHRRARPVSRKARNRAVTQPTAYAGSLSS